MQVGTKTPTLFGKPRTVMQSRPATQPGAVTGGIVNGKDVVAAGMAKAIRDSVTCKACGQTDHSKLYKIGL